jgi:hypothetical protein
MTAPTGVLTMSPRGARWLGTDSDNRAQSACRLQPARGPADMHGSPVARSVHSDRARTVDLSASVSLCSRAHGDERP